MSCNGSGVCHSQTGAYNYIYKFFPRFPCPLGVTTSWWEGSGGGRDVQVGWEMGKLMADSCWWLVETNPIL